MDIQGLKAEAYCEVRKLFSEDELIEFRRVAGESFQNSGLFRISILTNSCRTYEDSAECRRQTAASRLFTSCIEYENIMLSTSSEEEKNLLLSLQRFGIHRETILFINFLTDKSRISSLEQML